MTGFNDNEAIIFFNNSETVSQALNGIQQIPGAILPASWNIPSDSPEANYRYNFRILQPFNRFSSRFIRSSN